MKKISLTILAFSLFIFALTPSLAISAMFDGDDMVFGPGAHPNDGGLGYSNDDNVDFSSWEYLYNPPIGGRQFNWVNLWKDFTNLDPIEFYISANPSEGTSEYLFVENIYNNSGYDWTDYHVLLGVGEGEDFRPLTDLDIDYGGLDFDMPDADPAPTFVYVNDLQGDPLVTSPIFSSLVHGNQSLLFDNGLFASPNSKEAVLAFSIDLPDLESFPDGYTFTVRQFPSINPPDEKGIPEPMTSALLGIGLLGIMRVRRKQK